MKNKGNTARDALPLYEVTELTKDEALLAISDRRDNKIESGILSGKTLERYFPELSKDQTH